MDEIQQLTRKIKKCTLYHYSRVSHLIGKLQNKRVTCTEKTELDLIFYGVARGLEIISDYRILKLQNDDRLNELSNKIEKIKEREGLQDDEYFEPGNPDTPEDFQAFNIEFDHRVDQIKSDIMREFGEEELSRLFSKNRKEYFQRLL